MKYLHLPLLCLMMLACRPDQPTDASSAQEQKDAASQPAATPKNIKALPAPCQLTSSQLTKILGWEKGSEGMPNAINNDQIQVCEYGANDAQLSVSFRRYADGAVQRSYVQKMFADAVSKGSDGLKAVNIGVGLGDETIFESGKVGPNYVRQLRWHVGGHTEVGVSYRSSKNTDTALMRMKLVVIARGLHL